MKEYLKLDLNKLTTSKESKIEYYKVKKYFSKIKRKIEKRKKLKNLIKKYSKIYNNR